MRNNTPVPVPCAYGSVRAYIFTSPKITKIYKAHIVNTVRRRIEFKLALLIYKSLNGSTPRYLSDDCQLVSDVGRRRLRSSDVSTCVVPRTHTGFGDRRAFQLSRWTQTLEQSAGFTASIRHDSRPVQETFV